MEAWAAFSVGHFLHWEIFSKNHLCQYGQHFTLSVKTKAGGKSYYRSEQSPDTTKVASDLPFQSSPLKCTLSMMKISVKSLHFSADSKLIEYVEHKLSRLSRYFERTVDAEVHLKLQDTGGRIQDKITEIKLHVPGGWLVDKKTARTFEEAVDESVGTLKRQLLRHKEKQVDHRVREQ